MSLSAPEFTIALISPAAITASIRPDIAPIFEALLSIAFVLNPLNRLEGLSFDVNLENQFPPPPAGGAPAEGTEGVTGAAVCLAAAFITLLAAPPDSCFPVALNAWPPWVYAPLGKVTLAADEPTVLAAIFVAPVVAPAVAPAVVPAVTPAVAPVVAPTVAAVLAPP